MLRLDLKNILKFSQRSVRHGVVPTSHPSGNLHAGRPTFSDGSNPSKFGLGRRSRKWRTARKYMRRNNIDGNRTRDSYGQEQFKGYSQIEEHLGNLRDNQESKMANYQFQSTTKSEKKYSQFYRY